MNGRISGLVGLAAMMLVGAVLVAGCGGGEDTADADVSLTKAEFIKRGEALCEEAVEQREEKIERFAKENNFTFATASQKQLEEALVVAVIPALNQEAEGLEGLGAPEGDEKQVEEVIASLEGVVAKIESDPALIIETKSNPLEETWKLAEAYGLGVCARR